MARIHGHEETIGRVFSDDYAFTIPPYQRPYRWEKEQAGELLTDLLTAQREGSTGSEVTPYFLGSIVLIKQENKSDAEVIDGQQRLTTLSLLFAALRSLLPEQEADDVGKMLYEKGSAIHGTTDRFRLAVRDRDRTFFQDNILTDAELKKVEELSGPLPDPQKRFRENVLLFKNEIAQLDPVARSSLATFIVQHTFLIVVWTPDLDSAFRIFSVLNDRGLDLSAADILKSEIIGVIPEEHQVEYTEKWEEAEEELGAKSFTMLFSDILMLHARRKPRGTVLSEFRSEVNPSSRPREFIDQELIPYSDALQEIINTDYKSAGDASDINLMFRYLNRVGDTDWQPPAIQFLAKHRNEPELLRQFFTDLERLAMCLWLDPSHYVNTRIDRYKKLIEAIEKEDDLFAEDSPLQLTAMEQKKAIDALDGEIYTMSPKHKRTVVLLRLDEALSSGEAEYKFPLITIEHILPQTPRDDSEWTQWWPDQDEREASVHRIGNLALLNQRQNSSASNYEFEKKKNSYFLGRSGSTPFQITTQVVAESEWTGGVSRASGALCGEAEGSLAVE